MSALSAVAATTGIVGAGPAAAAGSVIRPDALSAVTWAVTSTKLGATGVTYSWNFSTTALVQLITAVTMTVPAGTTGAPSVGSGTTPTGLLGSTVALSGHTITLSGISLSLGPQAFHIVINGLTNTTTAGTYTSAVATVGLGADTGTSNSLTFGIPTLTVPSSLTWGATLTGGTQNLVDPNSADQQFTAADVETLGTGWNITVSATTFTGTKGSFSNTGTFVFTGSVTSIISTSKPTATCVGICTLPTNGTTYPVAITTAASSPTPVKVYSTASGTGVGTMTLGGSSAASPIGWWVTFPGSVKAGSYASTVTISIATGP